MADNNFLPLDLKEALFFETGYEVGEMVSISLDPDISLQSFNDYLSIRGVISLEGEYLKLIDPKALEDLEDDSTVEHLYRSVAKLASERGDQVHFYHHFPIDVSIPLEKISSMEEVTISVEAFDYRLNHPKEMEIMATLHIHGIKTEEKAKLQKEKSEKNPDLGDSFEFEVLAREQTAPEPVKEKSEKEQAELELPQNEQVKEEETKDEGVKLGEETLPSEDRQSELGREEAEKTSGGEDLRRRPEIQGEVEEDIEAETPVDKGLDQTEEIEGEREGSKTQEEAVQVHEQVDLSQEDSPEDAIQDIFHLAKIFNGDEEEQDYQLKLRIVQEDESLLDIAANYEIPASKIMVYNGLDSDHLAKGQLLLIPGEEKE